MKSLFTMQIGDVVGMDKQSLGKGWTVLRVPGGWIWENSSKSSFVPYSWFLADIRTEYIRLTDWVKHCEKEKAKDERTLFFESEESPSHKSIRKMSELKQAIEYWTNEIKETKNHLVLLDDLREVVGL